MKKPFESKAKRLYSIFASVFFMLAVFVVPAFAADGDPLAVVNISRWLAGCILSMVTRSSSQMPKNIWTASARNCRMRRQPVSGSARLRRTRRSAKQWMISCLIFMVKKIRAMKKIII